MNVGFDLDGVFIDIHRLLPKNLINYFYRKHNNSVLLYRIPSRSEQVLRLMLHHHFFRPPITKNIETYKHHFLKKHKYHIISSRFKFLEKTTNVLLKKYNLDSLFDEFHFNFNNKQPHLFKDEMIKKFKIDRFIDDDLPLLEYVSKRNSKTTFYWLNNKYKKTLQKNLFAINNISSIFK